MKKLILLITHLVTGIAGFALGIYALPILIEPDSPTVAEVQSAHGDQVKYSATLRRDLKGSDLLHWGEGTVSISDTAVTLMGALSPGPDYKLYFAPKLAEDEAEFLAIKDQSLLIGDVKTFDRFVLPIGEGVDPSQYSAVVIWCETFGEFISAATYQ